MEQNLDEKDLRAVVGRRAILDWSVVDGGNAHGLVRLARCTKEGSEGRTENNRDNSTKNQNQQREIQRLKAGEQSRMQTNIRKTQTQKATARRVRLQKKEKEEAM